VNIKNIFGAAMLVAATSMSAHADLVLDTFEYVIPTTGGSFPTVTFDDDGTAVIPDTLGAGSGAFGAIPLVTTDVTGADLITGAEGTIVGLSAGQGLTIYDFNADTGQLANPNMVTGGGQLQMNASNTSGYTADISYSDPSGINYDNPQNFAAQGDYFYFDVVEADFGAGNDFSVDVTVFDATGASFTASLNVPTGTITAQRLLLSFASFSGVDFTHVSGVLTEITAGASVDVTLDEVGIVPEPASIALLGLGLLGLGLRSRRKA
jgi:hypothetical protein